MKKVGIIGSGQVAQVLGSGFLKHGYEVMLGTRDTSKLADWQAQSGGQTGSFAEAAAFGDMLLLAVSGRAAESAVQMAGIGNFSGKTVLDATNPIAEAPPTNGVLHFFTTLDDSLMERLQRLAPDANFVKAFSCVGNAFMVDPDFEGQKPTMFICGNSAEAKAEATALLDQFGWETEDFGGVEGARAIEPLCILWCIPGFIRNQWNHAFKVLKR